MTSKCVNPPNAKPYTDCTVKDGKKSYKGLAVGYGKIYTQYTNPNTCYFSFFRSDMMELEAKFVEGKWSPYPLEKG